MLFKTAELTKLQYMCESVKKKKNASLKNWFILEKA